MAYVDSRGVKMPDMAVSEALEIVHDLADGNRVDESDVAFGDPGLGAMREWQKTALDTLHDLVVNHADNLDELESSDAAREWPEDAIRADRSLDPNQPANAIRICLAMAQEAAASPETAKGVDAADEIDVQQQAFDVVTDFIGMHASTLEKKITAVSAAGLF